MLYEIGKKGSPRERRIIESFYRYPRRQEPIGLAVTKVGINPLRSVPKVIVRKNRPAAFTSRMARPIDKRIPLAYKNTSWKYYINSGDAFLFYNSKNGRPFMIDKRNGARKPVHARFMYLNNVPKNRLHVRKSNDTWHNYLKRANKTGRLLKGQPSRNAKLALIKSDVNKFVNGNNSVMNKWTIPDIMFWVQKTNWMSPVEYVRMGGRWRHYGSGQNLTRNNLLNNIKNFHTLE